MNRSEDLINGSAIAGTGGAHGGRLVNPITTEKSSSSFDSKESSEDDEQSKKQPPPNGQAKSDSDLPKRPLSAYNLFFQLERENILKGEEDQNYTFDNIARIALIHYKQCRLGKPKRKHRKSHGVIGFRELARVIAQKWKKLSDSIKDLFEERAQIEKALYQREIDTLQSMKQSQSESPFSPIQSSKEQQLDAEFSERSVSSKPSPPSVQPPKMVGKPSSKPWFFETGNTVTNAVPQSLDTSMTQNLFQHVDAGYEAEPLSTSTTMMHATDSRSAMRTRPHPSQWQKLSGSEFAETMQYNNYGNEIWTRGPRQNERQPRRNSTSFYPIDGDEQVDLIQLNESWRESRDLSDAEKSEEESEMSAMLAIFETNNDAPQC